MSLGTVQANKIRVLYFGRLLAVLDACREERKGSDHRPQDAYFQKYRDLLYRPVRIETELVVKEEEHLDGDRGEMSSDVRDYLDATLKDVVAHKPTLTDVFYASVPFQEVISDFERAYGDYLERTRSEVKRIKGA